MRIVELALGWSFYLSAAALHFHAGLAVWKEATHRDEARAEKRAARCGLLAGGFFVSWALAWLILIVVAETAAPPGAAGSAADQVRRASRLTAEIVYSMRNLAVAARTGSAAG